MGSPAHSLMRCLPEEVRHYLAHTAGGVPLRALARLNRTHASTVLRQVRRIESKRDDPLFDEGLDQLTADLSQSMCPRTTKQDFCEMMSQPAEATADYDADVIKEAKRILRRLCESAAFLAVAPEMEKAVVMRETVPGAPHRIAVVERDMAHRFALLDWIACQQAGRISKYHITTVGRAALKRFLAQDQQARGFAEAPRPFQHQHQDMVDRTLPEAGDRRAETVRANLAESPLTMLGRKRDRKGQPYLEARLIEAGERLREDFEIAQIGPRTTQNWESFLTPSDKGQVPAGAGPALGPTAARNRVSDALAAMGPGLSDIAFRVCCFLEGIESAERRMGWSARSGKVVLRIALQRLADHYGLRERPTL